jgi:hypothetical protein
MLFMSDLASLTPTDRFTDLIDGLSKDVEGAVPWGWVPIPLIKLLWRRLRRMAHRLASILARFHAGTLPPPGSERSHPAPARPTSAPPASPGPPPLALPRRVGWITRNIIATLVRPYELAEILADPDTAARVAAAPQLGRVLRPLCDMLAVNPPAWLRLPRRPRRKPARKAGHWTVIRLGAGQLWRYPDSIWPTREEAEKFDAKIRVWVEE